MTSSSHPAAAEMVRPSGRLAPALLSALAQLSRDAVVVAVEREGVLTPVWTNPATDHLLRSRPGTVLEEGLGALGLEGERPDATAATGLWALVDGGGGMCELTLSGAGGATALVKLTLTSIVAEGIPYLVLVMRAIDTRAWADEELRSSEERFRVVAAHAPIGVIASQVGMRLEYVNSRFAELWGRELDDVLGIGWLDSIDPDDIESVTEAICEVLAGTEIDVPLRIRRPQGGVRWVRLRATPVNLQGRGAGFVGSVEDVTDDLHHQAALAHQASHDPLTGLPNRSLLGVHIAKLLADRRRADPPIGLLFFDLDDFKLVNDSLGHVVGDRLLVETAARLQAHVRDGDVVVRFGGDEFLVVCTEVDSEAEATNLAERLRQEVARPFVIADNELVVTASVGVVISTDIAAIVDSLVADADVAMYQAKEGGKNRCAVFDDRVRSRLQDRLSLVGDLRRALSNEELSVAYQPIVRLSGRGMVGLEALIRWRHRSRGFVAPADLILVAEENGMIPEVGTWVLRQACAQLAAWTAEFGADAPGYVTVNVSARQVEGQDFPTVVEAALAESGLSGNRLCLELTENVLMRDVDETLRTMNELKQLGVRLAIDDFGTGYSSLAYLKRFAVDILKVDRSFVTNIPADAENAAIISSVIALAHSLGLVVVAEGIETTEQLSELRRLGCTMGQGFLMGRPAPAMEIARRLRRDGRRPTFAPAVVAPRPHGRRRVAAGLPAAISTMTQDIT